MKADVSIRPVENTDSAGIIDLIASCFADYPNCILDVDGEDPALRTPADSHERMWVADRGGEIVGVIGAKRHELDDGTPAVELKKWYVAHAERGTGLARRLVALVEDYAHEVGAAAIDLWSDTRFDTAHAIYERWGWERRRRVRDLHDKSNTREYYFVRRIAD